MSKRDLVDAHALISESLPIHLKHLQHTTLFESLVPVIEEFVSVKVLSKESAAELISHAALALEEEFEKTPVAITALNVGTGTGITNYRFDAGYWEFVVRGPVEVQLEGGDLETPVRTTVGLLGIEGSGGSLTKGRNSAQGLRAAHTRQQALDEKAAVRAAGNIESEEDSWDDE